MLPLQNAPLGILLPLGCNVNNADRDGNAFDLHLVIIGLKTIFGLFDSDHFTQVLLYFHYTDDIVMPKGLLEAGADPNHCNKQGDFPILLAAGGGFIDMIKLLLKFGGKVDFVNQYGYSALHSSARGGHSEAVTLLLKFGLPHDSQTHCKKHLYH